ncbi:MAG: D-alanyl-D-alanine carboxypeptidase [Clostridiales bacterium]|nr:D-alanyl-D-alanine carboxypeptidase [Clostridiales bacterium]
MLKKSTLLIVCLCMFINIQMNCFGDDNLDDEPDYPVFLKQSTSIPNVEAQSAIVIDCDTGRVLYEKNAYQKRPMASTTKIMTAILAIENGNLNDTVSVSKKAAYVGGSTIKLKEGQTYKLVELLYGLLMKSGNDAAIAIAEHIGGDVNKFVEMMNKKALDINALDTNFVNPHGLDNNNHYTTAYDLANMARYAMKKPEFAKIVATKNKSISGGKVFNNTNEMLFLYQGCNGVKTGFTSKAGRCLVTSVQRGTENYIAVVLGCETKNKRAQSSKEILDYAYGNYKRYELVNKEYVYTTTNVKKGKSKHIETIAKDTIVLPLNEYERSNLYTNEYVEKDLVAPIKKYKKVGYIEFKVDDKVIAKTDLVVKNSVLQKDFLDYLRDFFCCV